MNEPTSSKHESDLTLAAPVRALLPAVRPLSHPPCWHTEGAGDSSHLGAPPGKRPGKGMLFLQEPRRAAATPGPALGGKNPGKVSPRCPLCLLAPSQAPPCHLNTWGPWGQAHRTVPATPLFPAQQTLISSPEGITQRQGLAPAQTIRSAASHTREGRGGVPKMEFNSAGACAAPRAWAWRQESQAGRTLGGKGSWPGSQGAHSPGQGQSQA